MLQVKDLVKRYVAKGETVTALDHVSVDFPERGMVFLLGKSGSGKSTLLNVSGGLDAPDEGEVIVNGKSSKDFSKSDFDSYRNTYLGFIFQEYNILNELTVEENVALALELQGKPKDREHVNAILRQVDLEGYGDRRPQTLSGGQKQRVAIARALVKDPEIIMGDEPTGALDSNTGRQVFDTLKRLSENKLVVIVSHDREFAEVYADRIIELKDGRIISDVTRSGEGEGAERKNVQDLTEKKLSVMSGAAMSEEDEQKILSFVRSHKGGLVISAEDGDLALLPHERSTATFTETSVSDMPAPERTECNFIKSKFPFRYALKMGFAGLRTKPVRLVFTTLLATVAFIVFGVFSTLITYSSKQVSTNALVDSAYQAAVLEKHGVITVNNPNGKTLTSELDTGISNTHFSEEEIERIRSRYPGEHFVPAYTLEITSMSYYNGVMPLTYGIASHDYFGKTTIFTAFADAVYLDELGYEVHGELPKNERECVVSTMVWEAFHNYGYGSSLTSDNYTAINSYDDLLGKSISIMRNTDVLSQGSANSIPLTIVGIVDTQEDFSPFATLLQGQAASGLTGSEWDSLASEFKSVFRNSMASLCWVGEGFYEAYKPDNTASYFRRQLTNSFEAILEYNEGATFRSNFLVPNEDWDGEDPREQFLYDTLSYGWWSQRMYRYNEEADPEGSYVQFLFAPLKGHRASGGNAVFSYERHETPAGYYYSTPYNFMPEIRTQEEGFGRIFAILGAVAAALAVFAALLLYNFISASIHAKKRDIGILRAVGARGIDVYKIFMVEGVFITFLCFVLGSVLSWVACIVANIVLVYSGFLMFDMFLFGIWNVLIILAIAVVTAIVSTTIPVALTVKKKPVEAIRSV